MFIEFHWEEEWIYEGRAEHNRSRTEHMSRADRCEADGVGGIGSVCGIGGDFLLYRAKALVHWSYEFAVGVRHTNHNQIDKLWPFVALL
jgi:hypothetical protein